MICEQKKCTGCGACDNICPKQCISMVEDEFGFIYPKIELSQCIHCNLCEKVCPVNNPVNLNTCKEAYAAWDRNESDRLKSTSGGIATLLSNMIINKQGTVYGSTISKINDITLVHHDKAHTIDDLEKFRGSKYVHSYTLDKFKSVLKDLKENKKVLYIGTPCQIAGLKSYLQNDYDNLYTVDIICHGVPSQKMLFDEIGDLTCTHFTFRDSSGFNFSIYNGKKLMKKTPYFESFYYSSFLDSLNYRENCYDCSYACSKRMGDITLGDFWGLGTLENEIKDESKGISLVLINTEKGQCLFDNIKSEIASEKRGIDEAIKGNTQLRHPSIKHPNREMFINLYHETNDFKYSLRKAVGYDSFIKRLKRIILNNDFLMYFVEKIKK